jgi:Leucine-rich repeat (LRR) protein
LVLLKEFPTLETLDIRNNLTDAKLKQIGELVGLKTLFIRNSQISSDAFIHLKDMVQLRAIIIHNIPLSAEGLRHLQILPHLEEINITLDKPWDGEFNDQCMGIIQTFPAVRTLWIACNKVTDAGLDRIRGMTNLERLSIGSEQVTDAGLAKIAELQNLLWLDLNSSKIGDNGVRHLKKLTKLQTSILPSGQMSDGEIVEFKKALPGVKVLQVKKRL